jgi:hypothetical protein
MISAITSSYAHLVLNYFKNIIYISDPTCGNKMIKNSGLTFQGRIEPSFHSYHEMQGKFIPRGLASFKNAHGTKSSSTRRLPLSSTKTVLLLRLTGTSLSFRQSSTELHPQLPTSYMLSTPSLSVSLTSIIKPYSTYIQMSKLAFQHEVL